MRLVARAFYDGQIPPPGATASRSDKARALLSARLPRPAALLASDGIPSDAPQRSWPAALQVQVHGVACVILDALTRRRWVKEDELAADILINPKQLRKTLRYLEEDQLVLRGAVRETPRDVAAVAAADGRAGGGDAPGASRIYVVRAQRCPPRTAASPIGCTRLARG